MKAALFQGPGDLSVIDVDTPGPSADELKIRVESCATCGTDAKIFHHGHPRLDPPRIIGHEIAGKIIKWEVTPRVTPSAKGFRSSQPCRVKSAGLVRLANKVFASTKLQWGTSTPVVLPRK